MIVSGEEFSKRMESLSDDTMLMISDLANANKELFRQALNIVKTTKTEIEIVKKLSQIIIDEKNK